MTHIADARILIVATNGFEQSELEVPRDKLTEHGATVHIATPDGEPIRGWIKSDWGRPVPADAKVADVSTDDYDALVLPGGQINPDLLRVDEDAMALIGKFVASGKPVAAICHAPWLLIEADVVEGRKMTSYKSIATDMRNAGADWQDKSVVIDDGFITSRNPDDLDDFVAAIVETVESDAKHRAAA